VRHTCWLVPFYFLQTREAERRMTQLHLRPFRLLYVSCVEQDTECRKQLQSWLSQQHGKRSGETHVQN